MRIWLTGLSVASLLARGVGAQSASQQPSAMTAVGIWRGTSVCLVRPSACNDDVVVYRIARTNAADSLTMDARKIVRGENVPG
jgi:hypothetical protein